MDGQSHTIFALATPPGRSGVAVVRVSGPAVGLVCARMVAGSLPDPRRAVLRRVIDPTASETIDNALILRFSAPASFTGEDVLEFHLHGGRAVIEAVIGALAGIEGCRPAEAGEFTRRAFENGKLDLTEVEGLADLIESQTEAQRRQALRQYEGVFGALIGKWREALVGALAYTEADLDFPDEDLPDELPVRVARMLEPVREEISRHLVDGARGERLRDGYRVAIVGEPNVGKSSLFNRLVQRSASIVSDQPGTTRDVLEAAIDLGGYPVILCDTAGLRVSGDAIEAEGVRRAEAEASRADLVLWVGDARDSGTMAAMDWPAPVIRVSNKSDLLDGGSAAGLPVSADMGDGIKVLLTRIGEEISQKLAPGEASAITRARHRQALAEVVQALDRAGQAVVPELLAEDLRLAVRALGRLTGKVDVEDLLDVIFRDFCIGK